MTNQMKSVGTNIQSNDDQSNEIHEQESRIHYQEYVWTMKWMREL